LPDVSLQCLAQEKDASREPKTFEGTSLEKHRVHWYFQSAYDRRANKKISDLQFNQSINQFIYDP
jgi:hypothetical protein